MNQSDPAGKLPTSGPRIRRGCIVRERNGSRLGVIGYAPYSQYACCVTWERRITHDIVRNKELLLILSAKDARAVSKLVDYEEKR